MDIKKVAVVGGGTMGNGIAHVFAQAGKPLHHALCGWSIVPEVRRFDLLFQIR